MRTILVNPRRTRRRRRNRGGAMVLRNASLMPNPRRQSRRRKHRHWGHVQAHRRHTHNPFMMNPRRRRRYARSNPLILPNRRRYRRRNASFSIGSALNTLLMGAIGGGGAYAFNRFVVAKIQLQPDGSYPDSSIYWHVGARAIAAAIAGFFLPTSIASATNGALAYASISEVVNYRQAGAVGADLSGLEADLSDVLDGY